MSDAVLFDKLLKPLRTNNITHRKQRNDLPFLRVGVVRAQPNPQPCCKPCFCLIYLQQEIARTLGSCGCLAVELSPLCCVPVLRQHTIATQPHTFVWYVMDHVLFLRMQANKFYFFTSAALLRGVHEQHTSHHAEFHSVRDLRVEELGGLG